MSRRRIPDEGWEIWRKWDVPLATLYRDGIGWTFVLQHNVVIKGRPEMLGGWMFTINDIEKYLRENALVA